MGRGSKVVGIVLLAGCFFALGMFVNREWTHNHDGAGGTAQKGVETVYTCPMHPFIISSKPGSCPICGMSLVRKNNGKESADLTKRTKEIVLSPSQRVMANLATEAAEPRRLVKELNVAGTVTYQQQRQAKVTAWLEGRLERLHAASVGERISAGETVAEIFFPELAYAEEEYLLAWKARKQFANSPQTSFSQSSESIMFAARERLRLLGFKNPQFAQLEREGRPAVRIPIYSQRGGIVVERLAIEGDYVNVGSPLFVIADLSTVWVEASVYENEFPFVRVGQRAEISSLSYPGKTFSSRVSSVYPFLDPKTRTVKIRIELHNPGLMLKPDMLVSARLMAPLEAVLAVPATAVMDTGKRQVVWVETGSGTFTPRQVKIGARAGGFVQILDGLARGERVAISGGYLLDSEAQFNFGNGH